jgi:hypothetical protein
MRRRPAAEVPRITSRSKLRSRSFITCSVHQIPLLSVLPQSSPPRKPSWLPTSSQLGQLLRELHEDKTSYFGQPTFSPGELFSTGCRYHGWALFTMDRLVREPRGDYRPPGQRRLGSRSAAHNRNCRIHLGDGSLSWIASRSCSCGLGNRLRGFDARLSWPRRRDL